jgi:imidazolonepropionase-like amidohydrolase
MALVILSLQPLFGITEDTVLIRNGKIVPVTGPVIPHGCLLIERGKIISIAPEIPSPAGAEVVDARGGWVMPGMISTFTPIGLTRHPGAGDDTDEIGPVTPHMDPIDALNPEDDCIEVARVGGVTTALTISGTRNVINGKAVVINLDGTLAADMIVRRDAALIFNLGARSDDKYPKTLPGVLALIREKFNQAERYMERKARGETMPPTGTSGDRNDPFRRDLELEALIPVLNREVPALFYTRDEVTINNALTLTEEFNLRGIIFARAGILKHADRLAQHNIPVIWAGATTGTEPEEHYDLNFRTAAVLADKGIVFAFEKIVGRPDGRNSPRNLPVPAALSVAHGLSEEAAIRALTINPAKILGVDDQMGSLEEGKAANIVIWSGSPIQLSSRVLAVLINGKVIPLENIQTRLRDKFARIVRERMAKTRKKED